MYSVYKQKIDTGMVVGSKEELEALMDHWFTVGAVLAVVAQTSENDNHDDANDCDANFAS